MSGHGLERRKQGGRRLANPGGGFGQQHQARGVGPVHRRRQAALPRPERRVGEGQLVQGLIAGQAVRTLAPGPVGVAPAQGIHGLGQFIARVPGLMNRLPAAVDVVVHQRNVQAVQLQLFAQHPSVHAGLCPVQCLAVGSDQGRIAPVGLDLFQPAGIRVPAVGPTLDAQAMTHRAQADLALVPGTAPGGDGGVPFDAVDTAGRGREAQVQVTGAGTEVAQHTHRHAAQWQLPGGQAGLGVLGEGVDRIHGGRQRIVLDI